jgi:glycosyltransferase involved in cell wall biosynthesis
MMRILFDHQIMDAQTRGGVSQYFYHLISTIKSKNLAGVHLPQVDTDNECFRSFLSENNLKRSGIRSRLIREMRNLNLANREVERAWRRARSKLNKRASIEELKKQSFDLFHPTYYDPYFLDHLRGKPFVLTIYDMIHEIYPEYFSPKDKTRENKAILAREAAKIIAISSSTKADIVKYLGIDSEKVEAIHLASTLAGENEALPAPESYVLHVGRRGRYKNFKTFFLAFAGVASMFPELHLICVNRHGFDPDELDLIRSFRLEDRCVNISANDRQLAFLYENASLFVYPSLYEGFGLPILEAFASGCPVAVSNTSCFPEVAGDAALYFDPSSTLSMREALEKLLLDSAARRALIQRGQERLGKFSWVTTAERTASLYQRCLTMS